MPVQNPMMYQPPTYNPVNLPQRPIYGQQMNQPNLASLGQSNISMTSNLTGRIIQNENEITPNEVAMDGSVSLFPLGDYSAIIAKQWNANGTISTIKYVPVVDNEDGKDDQIAELRTQIQQKDLAASQCAQNAYLIDQLRPAAVPAFQVPNPYANYGFGCYCNNNVA